jgi:hypothetical protein
MPYCRSAKRSGVGTIYCWGASLAGNCGANFERRVALVERVLGRRIQSCVLATAILALANSDALPAASHKQHTAHGNKISTAERHKHPSVTKHGERAPGPRTILSDDATGNLTPASELDPDLAAVKQAIQVVRQHKFNDATMLAASIQDPAAQKLIAWAALRDPDNPADSTTTKTSFKRIRIGRASRCSAGAPRQGCGKSGAMRRWSAALLVRTPPVRPADLRSRACC